MGLGGWGNGACRLGVTLSGGTLEACEVFLFDGGVQTCGVYPGVVTQNYEAYPLRCSTAFKHQCILLVVDM